VTSSYPPPAQWQAWQAPVSATALPPQPAAAPVHWPTEAVVAGFITTFSAVLGAVVGLIWPRVAPHIRLVDAINGSEAASKALLQDDAWLALLGILAGVVVVATITAFVRDLASGPGAIVGLVVGGVLGSLVAAQVGHLVQQPHLTTALTTDFPGITHRSLTQLLGYFGFRVRAQAALLAWPIAALLLHLAVGLLRDARASRGVARSTGAATPPSA
jgi:hypothetical protein